MTRGAMTETFGYDQRYRMTNQAVTTSGGSLLDRTYGYDPNGNLLSITDNLVPSRSVTYGYDDMDRLRSETHQPATFESWEYDSIGNRRYNAEVENGQTTMLSEYTYGGGAGDPLLTEVRTYRDGEGEVEHSILYDAIGNVVNDGIGAYTYDLRNKLLEQSAAAAGSPPEVRYRYDARGYRVLATSLIADGGSDDYLLLSGDQVLKRKFNSDNLLVDDAAFVFLGSVLMAKIDGMEVKHVISNIIGFPLAVVDPSGSVLWQVRANAFGRVVELLEGSEDEDPLRRYPGQWAGDLATPISCPLFFNGYRWYNADLGRYTQTDPVAERSMSAGLRQSLSLGAAAAGVSVGQSAFIYANNSPVTFTDELGLFPVDWETCRDCGIRQASGGIGGSNVEDLIIGGILLAYRLMECTYRTDFVNTLIDDNLGESNQIKIRCRYGPGQDSGGEEFVDSCKRGAPAGSVGSTIVLCGWAFYRQSHGIEADSVGRSIFHEWLHTAANVPGGRDCWDTAESITENSYRRLMKGGCGAL